MSKTYDVCIRGAGIVGRSLALKLATLRLRVALMDQRPPATGAQTDPDVRAYALSPASCNLLESLYVAAQQGVDALNWIVDVPELEKLLADAVRFQPLIELPDQVPTATLTIVCEGRASATRAEFGVEFDKFPYSQSALAARIQSDSPHEQTARQWFSDGDIVALLPMEGALGRGCALVWSASPARVSSLQEMDAQEFCRELQDATQGTLGALTLQSERRSWPLQAALARRWCGTLAEGQPERSWVLAGDAAHNVHPLAGQGLNLGLGDVSTLCRILEQRAYWRSIGDRRLLRRYERSRKAEYALLGGAGDALQILFQMPHPALQTLRNLGMNGFERSGMLKQWATRQAMGLTGGQQNSQP